MRESNALPETSSQSNGSKCPFTGLTFGTSSPPAGPLEGGEEHEGGSDPALESTCNGCPMTTSNGSNGVSSQIIPKEPNISGRQMKKIFPYHIVVDETFEIIQVGSSLPALLERQESELLGQKIQDVLSITKPVLGTWDWKSLRKLEDQTFFLVPVHDKLHHVKLKANLVKISDPDETFQAMIVLSPDVKNVKELRDMKLTMSDLPLHSFQRDAVFLGEHIVSEVKSSHKLDRLSKRLRHEQALSNALLYNLLPPHVADELRAGNMVQPELHEEVTLFFSDVVGFTSICDSIFPWDCVDLLNRLYCVMDYLAHKFDLYKIETIGDSYLCASGLPHADPDHARKVANFAIAVLHCSKLVANPVDGQPIRLRIGVHSGPCMTGVVGMTTPNYCVFGDTVNTAARHESTGLPDKIQCSSTTYGILSDFSGVKEFEFVSRGLVNMKGKGVMATYFLDGTKDNSDVNPAALDKLYNDVQQILAKRKFINKRYFKRDGRRGSKALFGRTSSQASSFSESSTTSTEVELDPDNFHIDTTQTAGSD